MHPLPTASHARYQFLDLCRALAAIFVLFQHSGEAAGLLSAKAGSFGTTVISLGQLGVVLFFMVSGYIIPKSLESVKDLKVFWIRRAFRIYPLYFLIMAVTLILSVFVLAQPVPNPVKLLPHLAFAQSWIGFPNYVGGSWTLFIELIWYIIFAGLFFLGLNRKNAWVFFPPIAGLVLLEVASVATGIRLPFGRICMLVVCYLGLLWLRYNDGAVTKRFFYGTLGVYVAAIASALVVGFGVFPSDGPEAMTVGCVLLTWAVGFAIFAALYFTRPTLKWLQYLGVISYSVYLVHSPVITVVTKLGVSGMWVIPVVLAVTVAISALTYRFVEEPFIEYSKRFRAAPKAEAVPAPGQ